MIKWNFTKFLIDKNGQPVKRYAPTVEPSVSVGEIANKVEKCVLFRDCW